MKEYRLPKEFAEKWLEALRSGKYKQCEGRLYYEGGYCCLGVSLSMQGVDKTQMGDAGVLVHYCNGFRKMKSKFVPIELHGNANSNELVCILTRMNDEGRTFDYIADWIEQNVEFY